MRIVRISAAAALSDARGLVEANWQETGFDIPFNPSAEMFDKAEAANCWFAFGAYDGEKLIGYSSAWIWPHPFNPAIGFCSSEALYVKPAYRGSSVPGRLIKATEKQAKDMGASRFLWHTRAGTPFAQALIKRGYKDLDTIVMKEL